MFTGELVQEALITYDLLYVLCTFTSPAVATAAAAVLSSRELTTKGLKSLAGSGMADDSNASSAVAASGDGGNNNPPTRPNLGLSSSSTLQTPVDHPDINVSSNGLAE